VPFFSCDLLHEDGSVSLLFSSVRVAEMINSLAENFKMRSNNFSSHATNICIFEKFSVEVSDAPEKMQFELTELQHITILRSSFN
jgi:hypothetical protein